MAVGMLLSGGDFTREAYSQLTEAMFGNVPMSPDQAPEGLIVHTAGMGDQGWYVYDVWESREDFERFVSEMITPAMGEGGGALQPQFFAIEHLVEVPR